MKLVREYLNEKFSDESDSIHDMGIGKPMLIRKWMEKYDIEKYTINSDQTVDINSSINFFKKSLDELPEFIQINHLKGDLNFYESGLKNLHGFPKTMSGNIYLGHNELTSIKELPTGDIINLMLFENKLTSLKGCTKSIRGDFNCSKNPLLHSLEGMPVDIQGNFICYGMPNMTDNYVHLFLHNNKIHICGLKIIGADAAFAESYS